MEIKAYWTEYTTKPREYIIEAKFNAREKETAMKVINSTLWMVNPLGEERPMDEDDEERPT